MNRQASTPFFKIRPTKEIERPGLPALLKSVVTCSSVEVSPQSRVDFERTDRKSTRLNSSHGYISYAVFCLKNTIAHVARAIRHYYYLCVLFNHQTLQHRR